MSLTSVIPGEIILDKTHKVIAVAKLTRMGLRANGVPALAKIPAICGCRLAVSSPSMSGAAVASSANVGSTPAVTTGGLVLTDWVTVVLNVGSLPSLINVSCALINNLRWFGVDANVDANVAVPYTYDMFVRCDYIGAYASERNKGPFLVTPRVYPSMTDFTDIKYMHGLDGITYSAHHVYSDWSRVGYIYRNGVAIDGGNLTGISAGFSIGFLIRGTGANRTLEAWTMFEDPPCWSMAVGDPFPFPEGTPIADYVVEQHSITLTGSDYVSSDTSLAPSEEGATYAINIPNLDIIIANNPGYTDDQVVSAALGMIHANPEYVTSFAGTALFNWSYAGYLNGALIAGVEKIKGYGFYVGADEWNRLIDTVTALYISKGWSLAAYPMTRPVKGDTFTSGLFNEVKNAIGSKAPTGIMDKAKNDKCLADDFNALRTVLNSLA